MTHWDTDLFYDNLFASPFLGNPPDLSQPPSRDSPGLLPLISPCMTPSLLPMGSLNLAEILPPLSALPGSSTSTQEEFLPSHSVQNYSQDSTFQSIYQPTSSLASPEITPVLGPVPVTPFQLLMHPTEELHSETVQDSKDFETFNTNNALSEDLPTGQKHKEAEQKRRNLLKHAFDQIRKVLPNGNTKSHSTRVQVLSRAKEYIQGLQRENLEQKRLLQEYRKRHGSL